MQMLEVGKAEKLQAKVIANIEDKNPLALSSKVDEIMDMLRSMSSKEDRDQLMKDLMLSD